jgi:5'-nucleotidase
MTPAGPTGLEPTRTPEGKMTGEGPAASEEAKAASIPEGKMTQAGPARPGAPTVPAEPPEPPELLREAARAEFRDLSKERGEPLAGGGPRGGPRALRRAARPLAEWRTRPQILVTNDDGIDSRGLLALKEALETIGEVTVVAPETNQSTVGHQKTLMRPLRVRERRLADGSIGWAVDGSPTDAVSLAFLGFFGHGFDLVASGINYGANLGDDITYSGTVSAAMEAVINGCPAFAVSQEYYEHPDFTLAAQAALVVARNILEHGLSRGELINVNVPAVRPEECQGFEITRLGRRIYQDQLIRRLDPRGIPYYWIGGPPPSGMAIPGTDFHAVVNRRIAVTPIHLDLTGRKLLRRLKTWNWELEIKEAAPASPREATAP